MHASFALSRNHFRAVCAFVMVSCVVKVFEAIMKRVVSGDSLFNCFRNMGAVNIRNKRGCGYAASCMDAALQSP